MRLKGVIDMAMNILLTLWMYIAYVKNKCYNKNVDKKRMIWDRRKKDSIV